MAARRPPTSVLTCGALRRISAEMDARVVGQTKVKQAMLMGIAASEHVYVEGPPGVAKTFLAEIMAQSCGLSFHAIQFHRDTRLCELVGEPVIRREALGEGAGEVVRQATLPGALLTCEVAVLDDISRAPGEALNALLRLLNEREYEGTPMPLRSAIATANPASEDYYVEKLDPAALDRFTLQVEARGLLQEEDWASCADVLRRHALHPPPGAADGLSPHDPWLEGGMQVCDGDESLTLDGVTLGEELAASLLLVLRRLSERTTSWCRVHSAPSLLTDRTLLVRYPRVVRASALLAGRDEASLDDLRVLSLLTTFRLPPELHAQVDSIVDDAILEAQRLSGGGGGDGGGGGSGGGDAASRVRGSGGGGGDGGGGGGGGGAEGERAGKEGAGGQREREGQQSARQLETAAAAAPPPAAALEPPQPQQARQGVEQGLGSHDSEGRDASLDAERRRMIAQSVAGGDEGGGALAPSKRHSPPLEAAALLHTTGREQAPTRCSRRGWRS